MRNVGATLTEHLSKSKETKFIVITWRNSPNIRDAKPRVAREPRISIGDKDG